MYTANTGNIVITPQQAMPLAGFADRTQNYEGISDDLEINLLAIKQQDQFYLLYSVDTFFVPEEFVKVVIDRFGAQYHIDESNIWMCASHTHFAPSLDSEKPRLGVCNRAYYDLVKDRLLSLTADVLQGTFSEVSINYSNGDADINVNRRKRLLRFNKGRLTRKTLLLPDYEGAKNTAMHLLTITDANGLVLAYLWSYACHPVHAFSKNNVSAEYIGAIRSNMRKHTGKSNLAIVFFQGFAGNLKADITAVTGMRKADSLRYMLQLWPTHVAFPSAQAYGDWVGLLWIKMNAIIMQAAKIPVTGRLTSKIYKMPLSDIIGNRQDAEIVFKKICFGNVLAFVSISAEVVTEYTLLVRQLMQERNVVDVAYTEGSHTYLPVDYMLPEKGYEVEGFKTLFGIEGDFKPSLDRKIADALTELNNA
ncbi:MAG: hypothetical protein EOP56_00800 [Sphingobacteriales bacterium]|nr:MAG: hypothetical protein EOP56_00800 [Sphingobacteriales bacterium]